MRWHTCHALSPENLVNLTSGRMIENIMTNQQVPAPDGGYIVFPYAIKLVGVHSYFGFYNDQPYVLQYWKPV